MLCVRNEIYTFVCAFAFVFCVCHVLIYTLLYSGSSLYSRLIGVIYKRSKVKNRFIVTLVLWPSS